MASDEIQHGEGRGQVPPPKCKALLLCQHALIEAVKSQKEAQEATLQELRSTRDDLMGQVGEIDQLLADMGFPIHQEAAPTIAPTKQTRGGGPRGSDTSTIAGGVETLLKKYKKGLSRADVTEKMATEIGYKSVSDDPKKYANNIYAGGIVKLVVEGKVIPTGKRPKTIYKQVENATSKEIAAFKRLR